MTPLRLLQCYVPSFLGLAPALEDLVASKRHAIFLSSQVKLVEHASRQGGSEAALIFTTVLPFCYNKSDDMAFDLDSVPKNTTRNRAP